MRDGAETGDPTGGTRREGREEKRTYRVGDPNEP